MVDNPLSRFSGLAGNSTNSAQDDDCFENRTFQILAGVGAVVALMCLALPLVLKKYRDYQKDAYRNSQKALLGKNEFLLWKHSEYDRNPERQLVTHILGDADSDDDSDFESNNSVNSDQAPAR